MDLNLLLVLFSFFISLISPALILIDILAFYTYLHIFVLLIHLPFNFGAYLNKSYLMVFGLRHFVETLSYLVSFRRHEVNIVRMLVRTLCSHKLLSTTCHNIQTKSLTCQTVCRKSSTSVHRNLHCSQENWYFPQVHMCWVCIHTYK